MKKVSLCSFSLALNSRNINRKQKHTAALAWDASCERSRRSGFGPDSGEEDNSELPSRKPRGDPGAASRAEGQAGSLPPLVQMARVRAGE